MSRVKCNDRSLLMDCTSYARRTGHIKLACKISIDAFIKLHEVSEGLAWGIPIEYALKGYAHLICQSIQHREHFNAQATPFALLFEATHVLLMASIEVRNNQFVLVIRLVKSTPCKNDYEECDRYSISSNRASKTI